MQQVENFAVAGYWRRIRKQRFIFLFNPVLLFKGLYHKEEESPRPDEQEDV